MALQTFFCITPASIAFCVMKKRCCSLLQKLKKVEKCMNSKKINSTFNLVSATDIIKQQRKESVYGNIAQRYIIIF